MKKYMIIVLLTISACNNPTYSDPKDRKICIIPLSSNIGSATLEIPYDVTCAARGGYLK